MALPLPCHHTLPSPPSTSVCTSSPRLPAYLLLSTYFSLISTPRRGAPWGQGLKPLGVLLYLSPPSSLPYWLLSVFRRGPSLPPVMPSHAAAVTLECTSCSRESSSALTCRPRTPCTPEILNPNPPKAKTSALAPQFPSCGPQQASRPGPTTPSVRGLQSKSTGRGGLWGPPAHRPRALASLSVSEAAFGLRSHTQASRVGPSGWCRSETRSPSVGPAVAHPQTKGAWQRPASLQAGGGCHQRDIPPHPALLLTVKTSLFSVPPSQLDTLLHSPMELCYK